MLAVPQIEEALKDGNDDSFGHSKWLWYVVLAIPVTIFALLAYISWEYWYKRKYIKSLFGEAGNGKGDDIELASV
jgi:heme/copper-type cytochrome/quinol oxidase subunit 2